MISRSQRCLRIMISLRSSVDIACAVIWVIAAPLSGADNTTASPELLRSFSVYLFIFSEQLAHVGTMSKPPTTTSSSPTPLRVKS